MPKANRLSLAWMRRNLRIEDNKVIGEAIRSSDQIVPVFIFDSFILDRFTNSQDRRLSFIANILFELNAQFSKSDGELLVVYGNSTTVIPKLANLLDASTVHADEDFEPNNIERDEKVKSSLEKHDRYLELHVDHLITRPDTILKSDGTPYKKFTPYMRVYKDYLKDNADDVMAKYTYQLKGKILTDYDLSKSGLKIINIDKSPADILDQIDYEYRDDDLWHPSKAKRVLSSFVANKIKDYKESRNVMGIAGTSTISPYLRFGVISIRECLHQAWPHRKSIGGDQWINELLWREFYVSILFHFPESATEEFIEKYRNVLHWENDKALFKKFCEGKTGFPIVDAAIRQLLTDGWMHNRCRMIVSSFLTKNLFIDWRLGEEFFAQNLMDYDLSSNVGGWQWSSSTGTDSQPYFRIFSPEAQQLKYDADAAYIKKYVHELKDVSPKLIHSPDLHLSVPKYPKPIVDYKKTRERAIAYFKRLDNP